MIISSASSIVLVFDGRCGNATVGLIVPRSISPVNTIPRIHMPLGAVTVLSQAKEDGYWRGCGARSKSRRVQQRGYN